MLTSNPSSPASHAKARERSSPVSPRSSSDHSPANPSASNAAGSPAGRVSVSHATRRWKTQEEILEEPGVRKPRLEAERLEPRASRGVVRPAPAPSVREGPVEAPLARLGEPGRDESLARVRLDVESPLDAVPRRSRLIAA